MLYFKPSDSIDTKLDIFHEIGPLELDFTIDIFDEVLKPDDIFTKNC